MEINIADLHQVFNTSFVEEKIGSETIYELRENSSVKEFTFNGTTFLSFNNVLIDRNENIFKKEDGTDSFAKGCDGVLIFNHEDIWYLCLVELKSGFTTNNFLNAIKQIEITYTKFLMLLEIIAKIDITKFNTFGIIVSNPPTAKDKSDILKKSKTFRGYCPEKMLEKFIQFNKVTRTKEYSTLNQFPLKEKFLFSSIPIHHIDATIGEVDILQYLN